jgi:hypothetical protein|tara:strand:+ start:776 stop:3430 length:2655 start_codon:yes stop_codon:yes gene_type:complete
MTETLKEYLKANVVSTILNAAEKEFRRIVRGSGKTAKKQAAERIDEDIKTKIRTYKKSISEEYKNKNGETPSLKQRREIMSKMRQEVKEYLMELETKDAAKERGASSKTINLQEHLRDTIGDILEDLKFVRYDGSKLTVQDILSNQFSADLLSIGDGKKVDVNDLESDFKTYVFIEGMPIPDTIRNNINAMADRLRMLSKRGTTRFKIHRHEIHLKKIFGSDTQRARDAKTRRATYKFWKSVAKDQDMMIDKLEELVELLKEGNPELDKADKDVRKFIEFMAGSDEPDLEYVFPFESKQIGFSDIKARSYEFLMKFIKIFNYDVKFLGQEIKDEDKQFGDDDDDAGEEGKDSLVTQEDEGTQTETAIDPQSKRADRADRLSIQDKSLRDVFDVSEVKELIEHAEKMAYDPLGILVVKDDLDGLMALRGEQSEIIDYLKEKRTLLDISEDDEEALFETFLDELETIESLAKGEKTFHLPIFAANNEVMRIHYTELKSKAGKVSSDIDRFLELFANLLQEEKGTQPISIGLDMMGAGTTTPSKFDEGGRIRDPTKIQYFKYYRNVAGRTGSPRQNFTTLKKKNKEVNRKINELVDLMAKVFITPQQSHLDAGIKLPFKGNYAMRYIAATKKLDPKFKIFQAINKKFLTTKEAFVDEEDIPRLTAFPNLLTQGDALQNFNDIKSEAVRFSKALYKTARSIDPKDKKLNNEMKESIQRDVAAILGSIKSISGRTEETFMNSEWGNNIGIMDSYRKSKKDSFEDITVLKTIIDLLESKHGENAIPDENQRKKLLEDLKEIKKSEIITKILSVHDAIRLIKNQPVFYSRKRIDNIEHMEEMINKMEKEYNLDISASEMSSIVNDIDSFDSISKSYGISTEHIYVIKANFR